MDFDPRIVVACCFYVVGISAIGLALRIWWTHPINRVFNLGPFVTPAGLEFLLRYLTLGIFALGLFALSAGAAKHAYWASDLDCGTAEIARFFGFLEMLFALGGAGFVAFIVGRIWLRR